MLLLNLAARHDVLFGLIGILNRRLSFLKTVFVAYPATQEYADAYAYRWVQRRGRWRPWLGGIFVQNGKIGLMCVVSATEADFYPDGDPSHNRGGLTGMVESADRLRNLLAADQVSFAGIIPGVVQARGLRIGGPEQAVTVEAVVRAEKKLRAELGYSADVPIVLLGGLGFVGQRLVERLGSRELYVVDVLAGRRINHESWPIHLIRKPAILINLTRKAVLSDYMWLFWKELAILNEVYPEPSDEEVEFISLVGCPIYHLVGVRAFSLPRFPRAYAGGIPCCAAWNAPGMDVILRRLGGAPATERTTLWRKILALTEEGR